MSRKKIILAAAVVIAIAVCWGIGKKLYPEGAAWRQATETESQAPADLTILKRSIAIEGAEATEDNPWGLTAGVVNAEGYCIFLTPGTGATITLGADEEPPALELLLHPQVASTSDGAGVVIQILDADGQVLLEREETVGAESIGFAPDWAAYPTGRVIAFRCNDGGQGNSDADWLLIRERQ